ncbi:hypothetical protein QA811_02125 [Streptomyces sp. B21-102]|uniref:hypothetical protein n=1 Tax=Streptomyces sp. B21-102 TaxID=3039416 RepID=UPI002FEF6569
MTNVHAILVGLLSVAHTPEQADHAARTVLDQHAHELAEQIRAASLDWGGVPDMDADDAADLIDPTTSLSRTPDPKGTP